MTPGILYVGVAGLAGSVIARNREFSLVVPFFDLVNAMSDVLERCGSNSAKSVLNGRACVALAERVRLVSPREVVMCFRPGWIELEFAVQLSFG